MYVRICMHKETPKTYAASLTHMARCSTHVYTTHIGTKLCYINLYRTNLWPLDKASPGFVGNSMSVANLHGIQVGSTSIIYKVRVEQLV